MNQCKYKVLNLSSQPLTAEQLADNGVDLDDVTRELITLRAKCMDEIDGAEMLIKVAKEHGCNAVHMDLMPAIHRFKMYIIMKQRVQGVKSIKCNGKHSHWDI